MTDQSKNPDGETLLVQYVQKALAMIEAGKDVQPTVLCREHPELAEPVAETLGLKTSLPHISGVARATDPLAGTVLDGRYRLDSRLGMGAMGMVYLATDLELRREIAVKMLELRLFREQTYEQRFLREAEILATLKHDHVVAIHDRGRTEDGTHYLVMDYLQGASLATVLTNCIELDAVSRDTATGNSALMATGWLQDLVEGGPAPESSTLRMVVRWTADLASGLQIQPQQALREEGLVRVHDLPAQELVADRDDPRVRSCHAIPPGRTRQTS